ncbi:MAG: DNA-directed RNA polymerase [Candidatus Iainarchaeum archaeon]|uniref:DNA-directed RNA polymerase subunit Rpo7 n=1 Tax=Candidatus Iainarchaeum sp. TaxID=3101447 RepID=A0A497JHV8_9ARCH|nr:MAG: DNA-directed RNA polymerase [Candidatus Diapherotrites archaeon]
MYSIVKIRDTVRVPPKALAEDIDEAVLKIAREVYEGIVDEDIGVIIAVTNAECIGDGKVIPGDGGIYFDVYLSLLTYKPILQEVVEGYVTELTEFGAFVRTGPIEGLIHVSQVMDDYINYDPKTHCYVGKESGKRLKLGDNVLARTVTVSLKNSVANSRVGYTMRQLGLGKREWLKVDLKAKEKKEKKKSTKEKKVEKK